MRQPARYSAIQIVLHWAVVALVLFQLLSADAMSDFFQALLRPEEGRPRPGMAVWHMMSGAVILIFMLARLALRFVHGAPPPTPQSPGWDRLLSRLTHWAFYVLLIALPVVGLSAYLLEDEDLGDLHGTAAGLLLVLVAAHVLGAVYHHFVLRDGLIGRMADPAPRTEKPPPVDPTR